MKKLFIIPLVIFLLIALVFFAKLLDSDRTAPSPLVGKAFPSFELPSVHEDQNTLSEKDLLGHYTLVNIFASWCMTCQMEHPFLMKLKEKKILPIYGINWKDDPIKVQEWLEKGGDPYDKTGADANGKLIIDLGVTGAPETFLVSPEGIILFRYAGVLTQQVMDEKILPLVKQ